MSESRPKVPPAIDRALREEAGYRCAIPTCRATGPFDREHIEDWAKVKEHRFDNMILLCKNCHGRVTDGEITKSSIRVYKRNLAILNGRYSLYELRMIEAFWKVESERMAAPGIYVTVNDQSEITHYGFQVTGTDGIHLKGLLDDGLVSIDDVNTRGTITKNLVSPTEAGKQFMHDYFSGSELE